MLRKQSDADHGVSLAAISAIVNGVVDALKEVSSATVPGRLLPMRVVQELVGYSRPSLYRLIASGLFPRPVKVGPKKIAFRESDIIAYLRSRPNAAIKTLMST